ncbi:MAG: DUF6600 domain-containing protein [Rhodospirillales bacterium]
MKLRFMQLLSIGFFLPCLIWAQEDEPGRGVARISLINGDVSIRRGDSGDWVAAAPNSPLVATDQVLTGPNSRAEVQFDYANFLRLSSDTEIRLAQLENRRYQVQMARGTAMMDVLRDSEADFELDTPNASVRPVKRGMYRVTVTTDGDSEITVREGEVEVFTPRGVERLRSGRTMIVRGTADNPDFQIVRAPDRDEWDRWNDERDKRLERSLAYQYVSRDIYGAEDLDGHGRWVNVPPYGWVWSPYGVAGDWAPYRHGRWVWVDYYGWTWLSYDPWGWAPYHYGRWFWGAPYGWCWYPGPRHHRHFWRPALVAFFGFGGHGFSVGVGVGFGNVGWVPLAPYEPFHPWYGRRFYGGFRNPTLVHNNITVINNTNIVNVYRNARGGRGVSGIGSVDFARGGRPRSLRISDGDWQRAALVRGQVPVTPVAESLRMSDRVVRAPAILRTENTRSVSRRPAPALERVSFEDQRRGMERAVSRNFGAPARQANGDGTVSAGRGDGLRPNPGAGNARGPAARTETGREAVRRAGSEGWRRMGERQNEPAAAGRLATDWSRFGNSLNADSGSRAREAARENQPRVERERERNNFNWSRFPNAGGARDTDREAARPSQPRVERERNNTTWDRFPSSPRTPDADRGRGEVRDSNSRWDRFGGGRQVEPRRSEPRSEGSRFDSGGAIRINPPIVRERSQPRFESHGGAERMSGGGGPARISGGGGPSRGGGGARGESRGSGRSSNGGGGRGRNR